MKKIILIFLSLFIGNTLLLLCQDIEQGSPLEPEKHVNNFKIGIITGINYPLSSSELTDKPTTATKEIQHSLLNGLNGLGYGITYNVGIIGKYPLSGKMNFGANIEYSGWSSINSCNCQDEEFSKSENALNLLHTGLFLDYMFYKNFYIAPEISFNIFNVEVTENSNRGNLDITKSYPRIGLGLAIGYKYPLSKRYSIDISAKAQLPNLLLTDNDDLNTLESESLINPINKTEEAQLFLLSLNIGFLFSIY